MSLSDFLAILDIIVTVLIGFVITHMVSVRDSRTRAIKDYYIQELAEIKRDINSFYSDLFKGELEAKSIIGWYSAIRNRIQNYDTAVRKTFRIFEGKVATKLFNNYKYITNTSDFNSNYNNGKIEFSAATKSVIGKHQKQLYMLIERTLYDVNNVKACDYVERKWREFKSHYLYYRLNERKTKWKACIAVTLDWLNTHKSNALFLAIMAAMMLLLFVYLGRIVSQEKDEGKDKAKAQTELIQCLDSLNSVIKDYSDKQQMVPVEIELPSTYSIRLDEISPADTITLKGLIKATK